jgi:ABC-type phosphate transport system substrate-binding protein
MKRWRSAGNFLVFFVLLVGAPSRVSGQSRAVAIVVHPSTPVEDLTFQELRRIFLGERQFWPDNSRVTLLVRAPVSSERDLVLDRVYRMNEGQFQQYWIAKMFRAQVPSGPKIVYSTEMARELVAALPGAITFMPVGEVGPDMKVLRIDGALPGEPGYPLGPRP